MQRYQLPEGFRPGQAFTTASRTVTLEGDRTALLSPFEAAALCARGIPVVEYHEKPPAIVHGHEVQRAARARETIASLQAANVIAHAKLADAAAGDGTDEFSLAKQVGQARRSQH